MPKSKDVSGGFRLESLGFGDDASLGSGAKQLIITEARKAIKGNTESVIFLNRTYGINGEAALTKWANKRLPDEQLMEERVEVIREKLITGLALIVAYEDDERAKESLRDFGLEGKENILRRAEQHPEFNEMIMWAKKYKRERNLFGVETAETARALEGLGAKEGKVIDSFADYRVRDRETLSPYLSKQTLDFFEKP